MNNKEIIPYSQDKKRNGYLIFMVLLLKLGVGCQNIEPQHNPWAELSWLNRVPGRVIITSKNNDNDVSVSYFNKSTREEKKENFKINNGLKDTFSISLFRPEIIRIKYAGDNIEMFIIPGKDIEIELADSLVFVGGNQKIYDELYTIGDHNLSDDDFEQWLDRNELPSWLTEFLVRSRKLKEVYSIYQQAGYQLFLGASESNVSIQDSTLSEELLQDYKDGFHHNYYTQLQLFKYNYDFMKLNPTTPVELENYAKRKNLFDEILKIEQDDLKFNYLSLHVERSLLRKRKLFKNKDELFSYAIRFLPEEHVLALNEIEKEYSENVYDNADIIELLKKDLNTVNGKAAPLRNENKGYKLLKFWFAGCAPCKKQIPYENELLERNDNLQILHFCHATEEETWKNYIQDNGSKGNHFFLDLQKYKEYKETFKLGYAPRYILLNEDNEVVCWECSNPSNGELNKVL